MTHISWKHEKYYLEHTNLNVFFKYLPQLEIAENSCVLNNFKIYFISPRIYSTLS